MTQQFNLEEDFLEHVGVLGMKWGKRKSRDSTSEPIKGEVILTQNCKNGTSLTITKVDKVNKYDLKLAAKDESYKKELETWHHFEFTDKAGSNVGKASFHQNTPTSLELEWIGVKRAHRSNGYARCALEGVIDYSKKNGITDLELYATKMGAPLYEKLGFVKQKDGVHRLHIPSEVSHSEINAKSLSDYIVQRINESDELNQDKMSHIDSEQVDDFLEHVGVLGMKWGKRRGSLKTRVTGAAHDRNQRDIAMVKRQLSGNGTRSEKIIAAPIKMMIGENQLNRNYNMSMNQLLAQRDRIETGRQDINDKIQTLQRTSVLDLFVSVTDTRE